MSTLDAFDYSWSRPDPARMAAAGIKVVARYLWDGGKGLTRAEAEQLDAHGIRIVANYEGDAGAPLLGRARGLIDGDHAVGLAQRLGLAKDTPVYGSCDRQVGSTQMGAVLAYYRAFGERLAAAGYLGRAYGQYSVIEALAGYGIADWGWQTLAWSDGLVSKHAALYQFAIDKDFHGSAVDYNEIRNLANLGAWSPSAGTTTTAPEDDMTPAQMAELKAHIDQAALAAAAHVHADMVGTIQRVQAIVLALAEKATSKEMRDSFCALGGQLKALPDGTRITSVGSALLASNAHTTATVKALPSGGTVDLTEIHNALAQIEAEMAKPTTGTFTFNHGAAK